MYLKIANPPAPFTPEEAKRHLDFLLEGVTHEELVRRVQKNRVRSGTASAVCDDTLALSEIGA
jgi:hypothetical protein